MLEFEKTSLWNASFGNEAYEGNKEAITLLRSSLLDIRERTGHLVSQIPKDIPDLTLHDLTHLDALWETASLLAGPNYPLNPAEAYVLGAAILLHDSALSFAAYPEGIQQIKNTTEWRDAVASRLLKSFFEIDPEKLKFPPEEIANAAVADVLRRNHATQAGELPFIKWLNVGQEAEYLIQNSELRHHYGDVIGKVAASHWWDPSKLFHLESRVNAGSGVPAEWYISPLKLACLLRLADAAHIDHRRAPRFLRATKKIDQNSAQHWSFQSKLGKPSLDEEYIVFTGGPFKIEEAEAWWLAYDMITYLDQEIHSVRGILDNESIPLLKVSAVKGVGNANILSKFISTKKWTPINTELRVSDIPSLVDLLGGARLYGESLISPVREMIQNAADAVRARRILEPGHSGKIQIKLHREEFFDFLEFCDDGVGMSVGVLTGELLDFGKSFWRSESIKDEFSGILSGGLTTTGKFGIGFFSVFMLGSKLSITTRRYDASVSEAHTLEFQNGLQSRPILREPAGLEKSPKSGTSIRICLKNRYDEEGGILFVPLYGDKFKLRDFSGLIEYICPSLDVDVSVEINGKVQSVIEGSDWVKMKEKNFMKRMEREESGDIEKPNWSLPSEIIRDPITNVIYGRASLHDGNGRDGIAVVGGFRACSLYYIKGMFVGETLTVTRASAVPNVTAAALRDWATSQAKKCLVADIRDHEKLEIASVVLLFGGEVGDLPIAEMDDVYFNAQALIKELKDLDEVVVYPGTSIKYDYDDDSDIAPNDFENNFTYNEGIFFCPFSSPSAISESSLMWPTYVSGVRSGDCEVLFLEALKKAWALDGDFEGDDESVWPVGEVNGVDVNRSVTVYRRP